MDRLAEIGDCLFRTEQKKHGRFVAKKKMRLTRPLTLTNTPIVVRSFLLVCSVSCLNSACSEYCATGHAPCNPSCIVNQQKTNAQKAVLSVGPVAAWCVCVCSFFAPVVSFLCAGIHGKDSRPHGNYTNTHPRAVIWPALC